MVARTYTLYEPVTHERLTAILRDVGNAISNADIKEQFKSALHDIGLLDGEKPAGSVPTPPPPAPSAP